MIAAVIAGVRNAGNGSTPPSISSRLPKVGSRFTFYVIGFAYKGRREGCTFPTNILFLALVGGEAAYERQKKVSRRAVGPPNLPLA